MPYYRLYHIHGAHFSRFDAFDAANDSLAVREAESLNENGHAELWSAGHRIKRLFPRQDAEG